MAAHAVYGNGRVFFVGDSSPVDDGSAAPGNSSIFDGWAEAAGGDSLLLMNATLWATRRDAPVLAVEPLSPRMLAPFPNPFRGSVRMTLELSGVSAVSVAVYDVSGRRVRRLLQGTFEAGARDITWDGSTSGGDPAPAGLYLVQARIGSTTRWWRLVRVL
jgi:hypothetical protein